MPELLKSNTFKSYLSSRKVNYRLLTTAEATEGLSITGSNEAIQKGISSIYFNELPYETIRTKATLGGKPEYDLQPEDPNDKMVIFGVGKYNFWANANAERLLELMFDKLKSIAK